MQETQPSAKDAPEWWLSLAQRLKEESCSIEDEVLEYLTSAPLCPSFNTNEKEPSHHRDPLQDNASKSTFDSPALQDSTNHRPFPALHALDTIVRPFETQVEIFLASITRTKSDAILGKARLLRDSRVGRWPHGVGVQPRSVVLQAIERVLPQLANLEELLRSTFRMVKCISSTLVTANQAVTNMFYGCEYYNDSIPKSLKEDEFLCRVLEASEKLDTLTFNALPSPIANDSNDPNANLLRDLHEHAIKTMELEMATVRECAREMWQEASKFYDPLEMERAFTRMQGNLLE